MLNHILDSNSARKFFKKNNIQIVYEESSHNAIHLKDEDGNELVLWAESDHSYALGVPGVFIEE